MDQSETKKHGFLAALAAFWSAATYGIAGREALITRENMYNYKSEYGWLDILCWPFAIFRKPVPLNLDQTTQDRV